MTFTAQAGDTLLLVRPGFSFPHLWVMVAESRGDPQQTVIVAVTTKRFGSDTTVEISPGEHPWVRHPSVIYYHHATLTELRLLEEAVRMGVGEAREPFPRVLLQRVQAGISVSPFTPNRVKRFCAGWLC